MVRTMLNDITANDYLKASGSNMLLKIDRELWPRVAQDLAFPSVTGGLLLQILKNANECQVDVSILKSILYCLSYTFT